MPDSIELQRLRDSVDLLPSLIAYVTADEKYALVNEMYREWLGMAPSAVVGRHLREVLGPSVYAIVKPHVDAALAGERRSFAAELPYELGARWVNAIYIPDKGPDGRVRGFVALINDISELKRLEHDLREQANATAILHRTGLMVAGERDLERMVQSITDAATGISGAEFGAFFYNVLNESGESFMLYALSGVPREAFSRFPMPRNTAIFEPTFRGSAIVRLDDVTKDPRFGQNPPHYGMPEGHLPVCSYLAVPVVSRTGEVLGGLFFGHSRPGVFSERVEALVSGLAAHAAIGIDNQRLVTALQRQREHAHAAARSAAFLSEASRMLSASLDHRETFANVAALAAAFFRDACIIDVVEGAAFQRLAAAHIDPAKHPLLDDLRKLNLAPHDGNRLIEAMRSRESEVLAEIPPELLAAHALDGRHLELLRQLDPRAAMIVPLVQGGRTLGVLTVVATGTDRKYDAEDLRTAEELAYRAAIALSNARLYAQAQEASRLKDEFLAIVSHELRTPLNAMRGWTSLLRSMTLDEEKRARALEVIDRNIAAQTQLVEDLLDISRIVSGRMRLTVQSVQLPEVIHAALDSVRPAAEARGITVQAVLDPDAGPVLGDPDRIQQIVWNLLSNAIKFTPRAGRVQVELTRARSQAELSVSDTGQGIEPEFLPHVFDRFRQGDGTTTRPVGGLGLGLAIVRHLVELHGGTVQASSPGPGKGSVFTVRLPVMVMSRLAPPPEAEPFTIADVSARLDGVRVLCVDDDQESCEVLTLVLTASGAEVRSARDASSAFQMVREWAPDALVSDIEMPGEDGYSLIQKIREFEGIDGRRIVAIAVTAYARREDRLRALSAGFQGHVAKPIEPAEIVTVLASLLGRAPLKGRSEV